MRIQVVEDDAQLGDALVEGLRQRGYAAEAFREGGLADTALQAGGWDAVVLDLGLPRGDGMAWLARWRARHIDVPVLILTARDGIEQRIAGLDAGADDYLVKPVTLDEIAARLRAMVRRSSGKAASVWQHGALEYDPGAKRVRWQGRPVDLTARETALLEALLRQPQRVLSKAHLQAQFHDGRSAPPESNTIDVQVYQLRRKIHPGIVRTVRGVGYALGTAEEPR